MDHLNPDLLVTLDKAAPQRVRDLATGPIIGYPLAKRAMDCMEDLLVHPPTHRMPNLLLVGHTNNGKTVIADRFLQQHPAYVLPGEDHVRMPVLMVQAPPVPDEKRFYNGILERLFTPYKVNDKIDRKWLWCVRIVNYLDNKASKSASVLSISRRCSTGSLDIINALTVVSNR
ncbi:TniB family NTP-binding protein [Fibrella forsythiae]|uniref:TniB family NTP-binding protein n=1 Tax=Fibrella forsythiae TaxID=2817061 RepID=A0ABS3JRL0_9BACT|nr:TniB family NTP-binding protein [Fibrella forsythiae]MBO0952630.1 TniB family NTP-binding protein [Fibrella forsythiae]